MNVFEKVVALEAHVLHLEDECARLEKALRFYADENNWTTVKVKEDLEVSFAGDGGEVAAKALGDSKWRRLMI